MLSQLQEASHHLNRETVARLNNLDNNIASLSHQSSQAQVQVSLLLRTQENTSNTAATQQMEELLEVKKQVTEIGRHQTKSQLSLIEVQEKHGLHTAILEHLVDRISKGFTTKSNASSPQQTIMQDIATKLQNLSI